jgi:hypothetical protein
MLHLCLQDFFREILCFPPESRGQLAPEDCACEYNHNVALTLFLLPVTQELLF